MKDVEVINDPFVIKIVMEETRNAILQALRLKSMSIEDLAFLLNKDNSTIYRHIKKLEEAGLVLASGKEKRKKGFTTLYERTAKNFIISTDSFFKSEYLKDLKEKKEYMVQEIIESLGFRIKDNKKFEKYYYEIDKFAFDKILEYNKDMDFNTLREVYTILSIIYVQNNGLKFSDLFEKIKE